MSVQCIPSVTTKSFILHLIIFLWCSFGIYNEYPTPNFFTYGGKFKYLTYCTVYLCWIAYGFATLVDFIHLLLLNNDKNNKSILISIRDYIVTMWASNLSIFVVIIFWAVAAVDIEGVHPAEHQKIVPLNGWYNHYLHTIPAINAIILITNVNYKYQSYLSSVISALIFGIGFFTWMWHLSNVFGSWPYGFIDNMSTNEFIVFIIGAHLLVLMVDMIGRKISSIVWNEKFKQRQLINKNK